MTTSGRSPIPIPWGLSGDVLELNTPAAWPLPDVANPDLSGRIEDYSAALERALGSPLDQEPFADRLGPGKTVAIVVDDPSRWTPVRDALPAVLDRLRAAGVAREDITVSAGVGRHHAVSESAMRERVGDAVFEAHRCFSPPVDDLSQYEELGRTSQGIPVRVFRPVAKADHRILIGSVLPHLQAGFGGGYKLIFPGTSHRSTLGGLHRQGIAAGEAGKRLGESADVNPMRLAIREAAAMLGPCTSISHLLGARGDILEVLSGHPDAVQNRLAVEAARRFRAPDAPPADIIVAGNNPWPGDPMQSFKVLINHRAAVKPGGVMIGLFWATEEEVDRSFPLPAMRAIGGTGAAGGWCIRRGLALADRAVSMFHPPSEFMIRWARELVVDRTILVYSPLLYDKIGGRLGPIRVHRDQHELWKAAAYAVGDVVAPAIRVFPRAGLTYVPRKDVKESS